jgi:hypothetical protein
MLQPVLRLARSEDIISMEVRLHRCTHHTALGMCPGAALDSPCVQQSGAWPSTSGFLFESLAHVRPLFAPSNDTPTIDSILNSRWLVTLLFLGLSLDDVVLGFVCYAEDIRLRTCFKYVHSVALISIA